MCLFLTWAQRIEAEKPLKLQGISKCNAGFQLTTIEDEVIVWSDNDGVLSYKQLNILQGEERAWYRIFSYDSVEYLFPLFERSLYIKRDDIVEMIWGNHGDEKTINEGVAFSLCFEYDNKIVFQTNNDGCFHYVIPGETEVKNMDLYIDEAMRKRIVSEFITSNLHNVIHESASVGLTDLVEHMQ